MVKIAILQSIYNLSDAQTERQILDRLSFMRFLGLAIGDNVPDEKTIWQSEPGADRLGEAGQFDARGGSAPTDWASHRGWIANVSDA